MTFRAPSFFALALALALLGCGDSDNDSDSGSSSDDPSKYRDEAEVEAWIQRDPVDRLRQHLQAQNAWTDEDESALQDRIAAEVNQAIKDAEDAGPPANETLIQDVYDRPTQQLEEQLRDVLDLEGGQAEGHFPL